MYLQYLHQDLYFKNKILGKIEPKHNSKLRTTIKLFKLSMFSNTVKHYVRQQFPYVFLLIEPRLLFFFRISK